MTPGAPCFRARGTIAFFGGALAFAGDSAVALCGVLVTGPCHTDLFLHRPLMSDRTTTGLNNDQTARRKVSARAKVVKSWPRRRDELGVSSLRWCGGRKDASLDDGSVGKLSVSSWVAARKHMSESRWSPAPGVEKCRQDPVTVISAIPPWNREVDFGGSSVR